MPRNYREDLRLIRQYTGSHFTSKNGYSLNKPLNRGQKAWITRYANKVKELSNGPVVTLKPKKTDKQVVLEETGQSKLRFFDTAIIPRPPTPATVKYELDRTRPMGSQLVATDVNSGQQYYHIPPELFLESDEIDTEFYEDVIREYAENASFFLIKAGESFMWGSGLGKGGTLSGVAEKVASIFRNYSSAMFDANDKNSSYYGNWFRGITAFTSAADAIPAMREALQRKAEYRHKFKTSKHHTRETSRWVQGVDGATRDRRFEDGNLAQGWIRIKPPPGYPPNPNGQNLWGYFVDGVLMERQWR